MTGKDHSLSHSPKGMKPMKLAKRFLQDEQGLETVEYAIIAGLVVSGLVAIIVAIGNWVFTQFNTLKTNVGA